MKVYGYVRVDDEASTPLELREVTFSGDPEALRRLAAFLVASAAELEHHGESFGHRHLRDHDPEWSDASPDVIVAREAPR